MTRRRRRRRRTLGGFFFTCWRFPALKDLAQQFKLLAVVVVWIVILALDLVLHSSADRRSRLSKRFRIRITELCSVDK